MSQSVTEKAKYKKFKAKVKKVLYTIKGVDTSKWSKKDREAWSRYKPGISGINVPERKRLERAYASKKSKPKPTRLDKFEARLKRAGLTEQERKRLGGSK